MTIEAGLFLAALLLVSAVLALGPAVSRPIPNRFDARAAAALRGVAPHLALLFTRSGRAWTLTALSTTAFVAFVVTKSNLFIPLLMIASQLLSQSVAEFLKRFFHRERPAQLLLHRSDIGFSYPSGHAVTAVVFFGGWALVALHSPLPHGLCILLFALLLIWSIGVIWSRLALGAHYATDVLGGFMLGSAWVCTLLAFVVGFRGLNWH